jgi:hypothetical protein
VGRHVRIIICESPRSPHRRQIAMR